jgi:hypothetical protein
MTDKSKKEAAIEYYFRNIEDELLELEANLIAIKRRIYTLRSILNEKITV